MFKKILVSIFAICSLIGIQAQENRWENYDSKGVSLPYDFPKQFTAYKLDENSLLTDLSSVEDWINSSVKNSSVVILIPNINGEVERYKMAEASVMVESLQDKYPNIRSFIGQGIDNPSAVLRMSYSPQEGFAGMVRSISNKTLFFAKGSNGNYAFYNRTENKELLNCTTEEFGSISINQNNLSNRDANTGQLSIFKLALTCNGEYGSWAGGTIAAVLAKFNATMTRVNGIYEQELAIHMNMIDNTNLIYLDANTDPYSGLNNSQIHNNITSVAGSGNFDIGHLVGQGGDGGNAGCIGCVCNDNNKAGGFTSTVNPQGDAFDIDYVAHEMGHQFGGNHTFTSAYNGSVSAPVNEGQGANLEPGSGSTIMAYAGITGTNSSGISTDVQQNSDAYFHFYSIQQITNYIASTSCQTTSSLAQAIPTANAGSDYAIPKNTPFVLTGLGTSDGATSFCWEENDLGGYSEETTLPTPTSNSGPSFRSLSPTISPKRYLPKFSDVVAGSEYNGALGTKWELLNTVGRTYKFKLTVRDNIADGAQNKIDDMQVFVLSSVGPFAVTSHTAPETWATGETKTVTWNVAGTTANGINTANVKISLVDLDGTELAVLSNSTANDGSEVITVPSLVDESVRIMVSAINNIYYAINSANLAVNAVASCDSLCASSGNTSYATSTTLVDFNTINNSSGKPSGYSDYTSSQQTTVVRGQSYDLSVNVNTDGSYKVVTKVWIDWNRDCVFNTTDEEYDLGEAINVTSGATSNSPLSIAIPAGASLGSTTMRVSSAYTDDPVVYATSCQTGFDGEVEDYTVVISDTGASVNDFLNFDEFVLSPNPNTGNFNIKLQSDNNTINVKVFDLIGRQIYSRVFDNNQVIFNQHIELNNVESGMYLVNVSDGIHFSSKRIIIQ